MSVIERIRVLEERLRSLPGTQILGLQLPVDSLASFEPSQLSVLVNILLDASLPLIVLPKGLIEKHKGQFKDREGYPDYDCHSLDLRLELKGHFCERISPKLKPTVSRREPSAR